MNFKRFRFRARPFQNAGMPAPSYCLSVCLTALNGQTKRFRVASHVMLRRHNLVVTEYRRRHTDIIFNWKTSGALELINIVSAGGYVQYTATRQPPREVIRDRADLQANPLHHVLVMSDRYNVRAL